MKCSIKVSRSNFSRCRADKFMDRQKLLASLSLSTLLRVFIPCSVTGKTFVTYKLLVRFEYRTLQYIWTVFLRVYKPNLSDSSLAENSV